MKAEELRTLDSDELSSRLRGARRELYELRFKLAVGQLDDHRQIRKVRKDIARILTVVHARRLGEEFEAAPEAAGRAAVAAAVATEEAPAPVEEEASAETEDVETPENVEARDERPSAPTGRGTRRRGGRQGAGEDGDD